MKGKEIVYGDITLYPEYCKLSGDKLLARSEIDQNYHIASLAMKSYPEYMNQNVACVASGGYYLYHRSKYRLHISEIDNNVQEGTVKPEIVQLGSTSALLLICYEIMFPQDYMANAMQSPVDIVLHMVGQPMFDENQREGWVAMQQALSIMLDCPVVCCCGGVQGRMNITGVTYGNLPCEEA